MLSTTAFALGQSANFIFLINSWTQGKINSEENVVQADINRAGFYALILKDDIKVIFNGSFSCGIGSSCSGKWTISALDSIINFNYSRQYNYLKHIDSDNNQSEVYKIALLNEKSLLLTQMSDSSKNILVFLKATKK